MSHTYLNELMNDVNRADNQGPTIAAHKPHLDNFRQGMTTAVNNGLAPEYCMKIVMLLSLMTKQGLTPDMIQHNLNHILDYIRQHPINITDEYIDNVIEYIKNK